MPKKTKIGKTEVDIGTGGKTEIVSGGGNHRRQAENYKDATGIYLEASITGKSLNSKKVQDAMKLVKELFETNNELDNSSHKILKKHDEKMTQIKILWKQIRVNQRLIRKNEKINKLQLLWKKQPIDSLLEYFENLLYKMLKEDFTLKEVEIFNERCNYIRNVIDDILGDKLYDCTPNIISFLVPENIEDN